jgi:hypothetical protein
LPAAAELGASTTVRVLVAVECRVEVTVEVPSVSSDPVSWLWLWSPGVSRAPLLSVYLIVSQLILIVRSIYQEILTAVTVWWLVAVRQMVVVTTLAVEPVPVV